MSQLEKASSEGILSVFDLGFQNLIYDSGVSVQLEADWSAVAGVCCVPGLRGWRLIKKSPLLHYKNTV